MCVCVYKKQEWGELTIQPVFNIPSSYARKKTPEILIIMQDKQNSNSSRLKISSYLTPKVEENQSEEVKLKKKIKPPIFPHKIGKYSVQHFHKIFIVAGVRANSDVGVMV